MLPADSTNVGSPLSGCARFTALLYKVITLAINTGLWLTGTAVTVQVTACASAKCALLLEYLPVPKKLLDVIGKSFWLFFGSKVPAFAHHSPLLYVVKPLSPILGWAKEFFWKKGCSRGHLRKAIGLCR